MAPGSARTGSALPAAVPCCRRMLIEMPIQATSWRALSASFFERPCPVRYTSVLHNQQGLFVRGYGREVRAFQGVQSHRSRQAVPLPAGVHLVKNTCRPGAANSRRRKRSSFLFSARSLDHRKALGRRFVCYKWPVETLTLDMSYPRASRKSQCIAYSATIRQRSLNGSSTAVPDTTFEYVYCSLEAGNLGMRIPPVLLVRQGAPVPCRATLRKYTLDLRAE